MRLWSPMAGSAHCVAKPIIKNVYSRVNTQTADNHASMALSSSPFAFFAELTMPQRAPTSVPTGPVMKMPRRGPRL